VVVTTGLLEL